MTGTNDKVRSIILTMLMVLSVFAGTVAFAGTAAAANNASATPSTAADGADGVTYTVSSDLQSGGSLQYIDIDATTSTGSPEATSPSPDFSAVTASDISVYIDGVEYTDGYTGIQSGGNGEFQFKLSNSQDGLDAGTNVTVVLGDVVNPVPDRDDDANSDGQVTYHFAVDYEDSGNNVFDSVQETPYEIDIPPASSGGTTTTLTGDAAFDTGGPTRWTGQQLLVVDTSMSADTVELHRYDAEGDTVGQLVTEVALNSNGRATIDTSGLEGRYVLTDVGANNYYTTNQNGEFDSTGGTTVDNTITASETVSIVPQSFAAQFSDDQVTQGGDVDIEFDSNRAGYNVTVESDTLSDSTLNTTFNGTSNYGDADGVEGGDVDHSTDGVQIRVSGNDQTLTGTLPAGATTGNSTFTFTVADTGESDSDFINIRSSTGVDASFAQSASSEERGDIASFTVNLQNTDSAMIRVGGDNVNYNVTMTVTDGDDDGEVTVEWNTYSSGRISDESGSYSPADSADSVSNVQRFSEDIPEGERLSAADYDLTASVGGTETDVAVIALEPRSTDAAVQWTAPGSTSASGFDNSTELLGAVSQSGEVASGDLAVTQVQASGIFAYVTGQGLLNENADGVNITVTEAGEQINTEPKSVDLDQDGVALYFDAENNQHFIVVDTDVATASQGPESDLALEPGETYNVTFEIDGDYNNYVADGESESVTAQFEITERTASLDTAADGNVTVESAAAQEISGTTNIAPGSEITVRARSTGDSPFLKSNTTEVTEDGTFSTTLDFQNVSQDTRFTVTLPNQGFEDDAETPGVVAPAPTASVSISDQTSDGSTVTVDSASLSDGGFVTIHDGSLLDGDTFESVRGTSAYLESGSHSDITVSLDTPYEDDGTAIAMPHLDTNGNEAYDFVSSDGAEDAPYTSNGSAVTDSASLTVDTSTPTPEPTPTPTDEPTPTPEPTPTETDEPTPSPTPTDGGGPGFGLAAALIALAGAALLALRRD